MGSTTISVRRANVSDSEALAAVSDASWREAYRGILPHLALEGILSRRGPAFWHASIGKGRPLVVLDMCGTVAGYVSYGRVRDRTLPAQAEIDELYLLPEYQGVGLGRRLFKAVVTDARHRGAVGTAIWCLEANERGCRFYEGQGARVARRDMATFSGTSLAKVCYLT